MLNPTHLYIYILLLVLFNPIFQKKKNKQTKNKKTPKNKDTEHSYFKGTLSSLLNCMLDAFCVLSVLTCLRACVLTCLRVHVLSMLACFMFLRAHMSYILAVLKYLACLRASLASFVLFSLHLKS